MFVPINGWLIIFILLCVLGVFVLKAVVTVIIWIIGVPIGIYQITSENRAKNKEREEKRRKYEARAREKARIDGRL